jgi:hypothetical protein
MVPRALIRLRRRTATSRRADRERAYLSRSGSARRRPCRDSGADGVCRGCSDRGQRRVGPPRPGRPGAVIALIGGCRVALAVVQPHGPVEVTASLGVWIAAVRLPAVPAVAAAWAITAALPARPPKPGPDRAAAVLLLRGVGPRRSRMVPVPRPVPGPAGSYPPAARSLSACNAAPTHPFCAEPARHPPPPCPGWGTGPCATSSPEACPGPVV